LVNVTPAIRHRGRRSEEPPRPGTAFDEYRSGHERLRLDPEARSVRHTHVKPSDDGQTWRVEQMLVDPEMDNDWVAEFEVNLSASRDVDEPVIQLRRLGSVM
jgi:hypothetical protein